MGDLSPHFDRSEFACKDDCHWMAVSPLLVDRLERLRALLKKPIPIVSGRRCPVRNEAVGGAKRSRHVYGDAADIPASLRVSQRDAKAVGFTGIGVSKAGFVVHVDVRPNRGEPIVWHYG